MSAFTTIAALTVATVATAGSLVAANEAADAQRDAARAQNKRAKLQAARQRQEQIRAARIARARISASAAGTGAMDTSGTAGGVGSVMSQLRGNLGFSLEMESLGDQAADRMGNAMMSQNVSNLFGGIANFSMAAASFAPTKPSQTEGAGTDATG
jgi:hypothetical protein